LQEAKGRDDLEIAGPLEPLRFGPDGQLFDAFDH
jgi:hypothetical protein